MEIIFFHGNHFIVYFYEQLKILLFNNQFRRNYFRMKNRKVVQCKSSNGIVSRSCEDDHQPKLCKIIKHEKKQTTENVVAITLSFSFFLFLCVAPLKWKQPIDFQMTEEKTPTDQSLSTSHFNISYLLWNSICMPPDFYLVIVAFTPTVKARIFFFLCRIWSHNADIYNFFYGVSWLFDQFNGVKF